jgi:DNA adenine methylase
MLRTSSPLRYPGGKSCLYDLVASILRENQLSRVDYAEPYAGGFGLALSLMYGGHVSDVHLNDVDPSIWSFWKSVLDETEGLVELIRKTPVTVEQWQKQKKIHEALDSTTPLELGFATFFLNRTNRSGVIKGAGIIGGLSQEGNYKLDCRFNRDDLIRRIRRVAKYRRRIHLYKKDAVVFMRKTAPNLSDNCFFCIDPPYFNKGSSLYTNFYGPDEHGDVARAVLDLRQPWIVTYDYTNEIRRLYSKRRQFAYDINYSVQTKRIGSELLIASSRLRLPEELKDRQINFLRTSAA